MGKGNEQNFARKRKRKGHMKKSVHKDHNIYTS